MSTSTAQFSKRRVALIKPSNAQQDQEVTFKSLRDDLGDRSRSVVDEDADEATAKQTATGRHNVLRIIDAIESALKLLLDEPAASGDGGLRISQKDIRTLAEAERDQGWLTRLIHSIEHYIWL